LLHCGHSLCHACLTKLPKDEDNAVKCPFDRQITRLGEVARNCPSEMEEENKGTSCCIAGHDGVWSLNKNYALIEMLERVMATTTTAADTLAGGNDCDGRKDVGGVPCDENEAHRATLYCMTCATHLCSACSEMTHSTRTLMTHRRVPLSEKPKEKHRCPYHTMQALEFVCLEPACQQTGDTLMCYVCKDYGRHKGHDYALIETEAEKLRLVR